MLSLRNLVTNWSSYTYDGRPRTQVNDVASFSLSKIAPIPAFDSIALQFRFLPFSDQSRTFYEVTFLFHEVSYQDEKDELHDLGIQIMPGTVQYIQRPSYSLTPCAVGCMCADFCWTWAHYVNDRGSGAAALSYYPSTGYIRKTPPPPRGRPWRNPNRTASICKHLMIAGRQLSQRGFLRP